MYIVYQTTHITSGRYYIGVHLIKDNDNYLGSGVILQKMLMKYDRSEFIRETLFEFDDPTLAFEKEKELLSSLRSDDKCINLADGGKGGPNFKGKNHTDLTKSKLSAVAKRKPKYKKPKDVLDKERQSRLQKNDGQWFSTETIEKIRENAQNRTTQVSDDIREKISNSIKKLYRETDLREKIRDSANRRWDNPEERQKHSAAMAGKHVGKKWVRNDQTGHIIRIKPDELETYLTSGYRLGRFK